MTDMNGMTAEQEFTDTERKGGTRYVWECAIGGRKPIIIPPGGDLPMRNAVEAAFREVTGQDAEWTYSGWGRKFTEKAMKLAPQRKRTVSVPMVVLIGCAAFVLGFAQGLLT